jgi:hypothetical protein
MTCSICMNDIVDCVKTPCDHEFCNCCLTQWLMTKNSCPMCRHKLGEKEDEEQQEDEEDVEEIEIQEEMDDGVLGQYIHTIDGYYEDFEDRLFDLADNFEDDEYLKAKHVLIEDNFYVMKIVFEENKKTVSAVISYSPENNFAKFFYSMNYNTTKRTHKRRVSRVNKKLNNRKMSVGKNFKCVR